MDSALRVFEATGLGRVEALTVIETVSAHIWGHITLVLVKDQARRWVDPEGMSWQNTQPAYGDSLSMDRFPALASITHTPRAMEVFEVGRGWMLDGVAATIRAQAPGNSADSSE